MRCPWTQFKKINIPATTRQAFIYATVQRNMHKVAYVIESTTFPYKHFINKPTLQCMMIKLYSWHSWGKCLHPEGHSFVVLWGRTKPRRESHPNTTPPTRSDILGSHKGGVQTTSTRLKSGWSPLLRGSLQSQIQDQRTRNKAETGICINKP